MDLRGRRTGGQSVCGREREGRLREFGEMEMSCPGDRGRALSALGQYAESASGERVGGDLTPRPGGISHR